ncbi:MAG: signal peptidase II [Bacilli bacterium]
MLVNFNYNRYMRKNVLKYSIISLFIIFFDQVLKIIASTNMIDEICVIKNFLYLVFTINNGAAFSILQGKLWFLIVISLIMLIYLIIESLKYIKNNNKRVCLPLSFIIGGLIGNLIDRIYFGYVRDFISFQIGSYNAPIFNVADIFLVFGAIYLVYEISKG